MTTPQAGNSFSLGNAVGYVDINTASANSALQGLQGQMQSFFSSTQQMGQQISSFGQSFSLAMLPVAGAMATGIKAAGSFEDAMAEIAARTGLTGEALDEIRNKALQMGADTSFSAQQSADAFLQLLSSGSSAAEALAQIEPVLRGAEASGSDLAFTADALTDIMAAMGLEASQSAEVMDALVDASGSSSASFTDLAAGFANVGPVARTMGMSVEEVAATLAVFSENGIKGAEAGTQLKSMLDNMTRQTDDVQGMWQQLGISMFDAGGNARSLNDIIADLNVAMEGMNDQQRKEVISTLAGSFGQMGLSALLASGGIEDMQATMETQTHFTEIATERMNTFNGLMMGLTGSIETLMITAFTPFIESMKPGIRLQTQIVNSLTQWVAANQRLVQPFLHLLKIMLFVGPALIIIGKVLPIVVAGFGALFSPIGLAIVAIAALSAAWSTNFGNIQYWTQAALAVVHDIFMYKILPIFAPVTKVIHSLQLAWRILNTNLQAGNSVVRSVVQAWTVFATSLGASWETVQKVNQHIFAFFDGLNKGFQFAKGIVLTFFEAIQDSFHAFEFNLENGKSHLQAFGFALMAFAQTMGVPIPTILRLREIVLQAFTAIRNAINTVLQPVRSAIHAFNLTLDSGKTRLEALGFALMAFANSLGVPVSVIMRVREVFLGTLNAIRSTVSNIIGIAQTAFILFGFATEHGSTKLEAFGIAFRFFARMVGLPVDAFYRFRDAITSTMTRIVNAVKPLLLELGIFFSNLFSNLNTGQLTSIGAKLFSFGRILFQLMSPLGQIQLVLRAFGIDLFPMLLRGFETVMGMATRFFQSLNFGMSVTDSLKRSVGNASWMDTLINGFASVGNFITGTALPALGQLRDWFLTSALPGIVAFVTTTVVPAISSFFGMLSDAWATIQPNIGPMANWFATFLGQLITILWQAGKLLVDFALVAIPIVASAITNVILPAVIILIGWIQSLWTATKPHLQAMWDWFIVTGLPAIKDFLINTALPAIQTFFNFLRDVWILVQPALQSLWDWFIVTGLPAIQTFVETIVLPALQAFFNFLKDVWVLISPALTALWDWFMATGLPLIKDFIETIVIPAVQGFIDLLSGIWNSVSAGVDALKTGLETAFNFIKNNVIDPVKNAIQTVVDAFNNAKNLLSGGLNFGNNQPAPAIPSGSGVTSQGGIFASGGSGASGSPAVAMGTSIRGFAQGTNLVPKDMLAVIHRNEAIVPERYNPAAGGTGGGAKLDFAGANFYFTANSDAEARSHARSFKSELEELMRSS